MKRLSCILLFAAISLTACKKKYCWECITETSGAAVAPTTTASYCEMTEEDIKNKVGTTNTPITVGGKTVMAVTTTTCKKK